jgi:hypothetical protein
MATEHVHSAFNIIPQKQRTENSKPSRLQIRRVCQRQRHTSYPFRKTPAGQEAKSTSSQMRYNICKTNFPRYDEDHHGGDGTCCWQTEDFTALISDSTPNY